MTTVRNKQRLTGSGIDLVDCGALDALAEAMRSSGRSFPRRGPTGLFGTNPESTWLRRYLGVESEESRPASTPHDTHHSGLFPRHPHRSDWLERLLFFSGLPLD